MRAYYKIREARVRKRIFEMVKAVGAASYARFWAAAKGAKPGALPADQSSAVAFVRCPFAVRHR